MFITTSRVTNFRIKPSQTSSQSMRENILRRRQFCPISFINIVFLIFLVSIAVVHRSYLSVIANQIVKMVHKCDIIVAKHATRYILRLVDYISIFYLIILSSLLSITRTKLTLLSSPFPISSMDRKIFFSFMPPCITFKQGYSTEIIVHACRIFHLTSAVQIFAETTMITTI